MFQTESLSNHCFQPNGSFPDDPSYVQWRNRFLLPEFSVSVCIRWKLFLHFVEIRWTMTITSINLDTNRLFTQLRNSLNLTNNETGFASMRSGGWEIGCSATACLLTMTSWTYVRKSPYIYGDVKKSDEILRMRKHFEVSFLRPGSQEEADGSLPEWFKRLWKLLPSSLQASRTEVDFSIFQSLSINKV